MLEDSASSVQYSEIFVSRTFALLGQPCPQSLRVWHRVLALLVFPDASELLEVPESSVDLVGESGLLLKLAYIEHAVGTIGRPVKETVYEDLAFRVYQEYDLNPDFFVLQGR